MVSVITQVAGALDHAHGKGLIHPSQIEPANRAFSPTEAEIAHARAVIAAFEANPGAGALQLDGKMIDAPHLKSARRLLALVD